MKAKEELIHSDPSLGLLAIKTRALDNERRWSKRDMYKCVWQIGDWIDVLN